MNECPECNSKDVRVAIHTDYKKCNKCHHFWEVTANYQREMKTPIQEAEEYILGILKESEVDMGTYGLIELKFREMSKKEKEVMCEFADKYRDDSCFATFSGDVSSEQTTEEFFELTFKNKER